MEKTNWGKIIIEAIITVLITSIFTYAISYFITRNICNISIGTSIINENEIMTPITISNTSKKIAIEKLEISVGEFNKIESGISNLSYQIDNVNNIITLNYIPPMETTSVILITKEKINLNSVKIAYDGNVSTTYLENKTDIYIIVVSQAMMYLIMLIISQYLFDKKNKKYYLRLKEVEETLDKDEKETQQLRTESQELKKDAKETHKELYKIKLYYLTRMSDYEKELNFWKDTIRKFIYQSGINTKSGDKLFELVTDTLKTYSTKSDAATNINEIYYLAHMMNENNKEGQNKEI